MDGPPKKTRKKIGSMGSLGVGEVYAKEAKQLTDLYDCKDHLPEALSNSKVVEIKMGLTHTLIRTEKGEVFAAGQNNKSQCGGQRAVVFSFRKVRKAVNCCQIATGAFHCVARLMDGSAIVWGRNRNGEATIFNKEKVIKKPKRLGIKCKVRWIGSGGNCTLWIDESGSLHGSGKVRGKWLASKDTIDELGRRFTKNKEDIVKLEGKKGEEIKVGKAWVGEGYVLAM